MATVSRIVSTADGVATGAACGQDRFDERVVSAVDIAAPLGKRLLAEWTIQPFTRLSTVEHTVRADHQQRRRRRNRRGEGERLRGEIVGAAQRVLARGDDLSLRAVARDAGITAPAIYAHFDDLQALRRAVVEERFAALHTAVDQAMAAANGAAEALHAACRAYCHYALEHPGHYLVLFEASESHLGVPYANSPGAQVFELLVGAVAAAMDSGAAPPDDPFQVAAALWGAMHGVVALRIHLPGFPWPPFEPLLSRTLAGVTGLTLPT